jgi:type VI secretion system protein ImpE
MASNQAQELFREGRLADATTAATAELRRHPDDTSTRALFIELLCFAGEIERADKQLEMLAKLDTSQAVGISSLRQVLRGELARQQFHAEGRLPEFLDQPPPWIQLYLRASIHLRDGEPAEAKRLLDEAEAARPRVTGVCDGVAFDDFRDLDDLTAGVFEVITAAGKYYWVPTDRIESVEFTAPSRAHELIWRPARVSIRGGPDGQVYFPTLYAGSAAEADDNIRLGRMTDWRGGDGSPVRGIGQRVFLVGSADKSIMEIQQLTIQEHRAGG